MRLRSAQHSPIALALAILLIFSANLFARTASAASHRPLRAEVEVDQPSDVDKDGNPVDPNEEEKPEPADQCAVCDSLNDVRADLSKHKKYGYSNTVSELTTTEFAKEPAKRLMQVNAYMDLVVAALTYDQPDDDSSSVDTAFFDTYKICTAQIRAYVQKLPKARQMLLRDSLRRGYQNEQQVPPDETNNDQDSTPQVPAKSKK